jgi:GDP-L-fucose synthase
MKVLLTGGTGMVGRNFLDRSVFIDLDFFNLSPFDTIAPTHQQLDLLDAQAVLRFIETQQPDIIIHAAGAVGGIEANIRNPVKMLVENLDMGRNVVLAARKVGIKKLIFLGSSCMYPKNSNELLREEQILNGPLEPTNEGYALAKIAILRLCQYINREDPSFSYKTLIPANLYGRYDNFNPERSHLVAATIAKLHQAVVNKEKIVDIWGDGTNRREFMYAGDLADALVRAVVEFDSLPEVMNVGTGTDRSVRELYETIAGVVGYNGAFRHDLSKPTGVYRKTVECSKQRDWGWSPSTSLENGLRITYSFYKENL